MDLRIRPVPEQLHTLAKLAAGRRRQSLNAWVIEQIRGGVLRAGRRDPVVAAALDGVALDDPPAKKGQG